MRSNQLNIQSPTGEKLAIFNQDNDVELYYDDSLKLATTATGIDVTGGITSSGNLTVNGADVTITANIIHSGDGDTYFGFNANDSYRVVTGGTQRLLVNSSGIDVTGTVTADGLTVLGTDTALVASIGTDAQRVYITPDGTEINYNASGNSAGSHMFQTGNVNRLNIAVNGDISFYEDTGTTAKFFWDASAESLGIGTSSPSALLEVATPSSGSAAVFNLLDNTADGFVVKQGTNEYVNVDTTNGAEVITLGNTTTIADVIIPAGNVGIGTSSPATQLHVNASSGDVEHRIEAAGSGNDTILSLKNLNTGAGAEGHIRFMDGATTAGAISYLHNAGGVSDAMTFYTASSEAMRIDSSGNLLVGTTDKPSASVHGGTMITRDLDSEANKTSTSATTGVAHFVFFNPNGSVGSISTNGSATAFNTSSDLRLKENIVDAPSASDDIDAIQVRSFDWKADGSHQKYGMVAQELQSVAPEAVSGDADSDEMMGVDYSKLVPMLVKEIQSLRARVAELESN
jgi:hypothetical protein